LGSADQTTLADSPGIQTGPKQDHDFRLRRGSRLGGWTLNVYRFIDWTEFMGFRAAQWWRNERPKGLETAQICIMWESCYSCLDDTAFLERERAWLMEKCNLSLRSLERHLPQLAKLQLLVAGDGGFRLPLFYEYTRQFGGVTANLSAHLAERKERV